MSSFTNSNYMLKYQKAKAKLVEHSIPQTDYPRFPLNSNELSYSVIYTLSRFAEGVIENNTSVITKFSPYLTASAQYFDASVGAKDRTIYDIDFLLSGAAAFFLSDDYGSSKVLCAEYFHRINQGVQNINVPQRILGSFLGFILLNQKIQIINDTPTGEKLCYSLLKCFKTGEGIEEIRRLLVEYRKEIYDNDIPMELYYVDILFAVVIFALSRSSWTLLPQYSELNSALWSDYLKSSKSPKILWPAQQLIGERGVLSGRSAIVQLPTGVGKTKSIELIIRSSFFSKRTTTAIIVAPLRALCNEIANEMTSAFRNEALVNQFSDVLEDDFSSDGLLSLKNSILVCTPEKFSYIIHHQADFIDEIGLYIFDESHMFDDASRGATYELLITEIRDRITSQKQIILLSAVLSNAEQIKDWLLGDEGVLLSDPRIKSTPKMIGFTSSTNDIHYYSDSTQEDFFIPRSIEVLELQKRPRETRKRFFPETTDAKDIAIYFANRLCKNGAAAIFANRTSTVKTIIDRIIELNARQFSLTGIKANSDYEELNRLARLMSDYYGDEYSYTIACNLGVLPHYSSLPNGIRLAVEHAVKMKALSLIVCTSTLAQGVNIPIKYLFITSFRVARNSMQVRSFQNLIGRTARSGMHTEGSVIVTDSQLYDNKNTHKNGGYYKWQDCVKLFDSNAAEPCGSSILSLVQNVTVDYELSIKGDRVVQFIIDHYDEPELFGLLVNSITKFLKKKYPKKSAENIVDAIMARERTVEAIENYLCFASINSEDEDKEAVAIEICKKSLAYYMANEIERSLLERLFRTIATKINNLSSQKVKKYARSMVGIDLSLAIENWISDNLLAQQDLINVQILEKIISFFLETHPRTKRSDCFSDICKMWIEGRSFYEMQQRLSLPITDLEGICSKSISYELSFFIGSIIDIFEATSEETIIPTSELHLLQSKVKYGVNTETAVSICEKVFNDRFLAILLAKELDDDSIDPQEIVGIIMAHEKDIQQILIPYPTCFRERIAWLCNGQ